MGTWLAIIGLSALTGLLSANFIRNWIAWVASAAIPFFALLTYLLFNEYVMPYRGGGASMWPIAQLFGGTVAIISGLTSCAIFRFVESALIDKNH